MKYGLYFISSNGQGDWLRETDKSISIWESTSEAEHWRKNHTVHPNHYTVKRVTPTIIKDDWESMHK